MHIDNTKKQTGWKLFRADRKIKIKPSWLYLICVLLPLILTDSIIISSVMQSAESTRWHNMENVASAVQYSFINRIDSTATTAESIYGNKYINRFLERQFSSTLDFVTSYQDFMKDTLYESGFGDTTLLKLYADNESIVNGGIFGRVESVRESDWYLYMKQSGLDEMLYAYYDDSRYPAVTGSRKLIFVRNLTYYGRDIEKIVKLELDYSSIVQGLKKMNYDVPVYICYNDMILLSNEGHNSIAQDFDTFTEQDKVGYTKEMNLYGMDMQIYVLKQQEQAMDDVADNLPIVLVLVLVNIILPLLVTKVINRNKLREKEMDIARQNAELLALHSQINPHFLFNALESIRMHSILKEEYETAGMVEKLAVMERQNVEWGNDCVEIEKEMDFVKAYLGLQKYRFGERLSYELTVEEGCEQLKIPKLTVVTFVENACVHGIESKTTPGWIFVRVYKEQERLCLEIEDTGSGMEDTFREEMLLRMEQASIDSLKEKGRVGVINACLRLKMVTNNEVSFELDGEKGVGTMVLIRIPLAYV